MGARSLRLPLLGLWCLLRCPADAAPLKALASSAMAQGLSSLVATDWAFVTYESKPSPADLAEVAVVVKDFATAVPYDDLPGGRLLQLSMTGFDQLNLTEIPGGWYVANVHQGGIPISEYVIAAVLNWNIRLFEQDALFKKCTWHSGPNTCPPPFGNVHREAFGQTIGIVGYGAIGGSIAARAHALGMRVVAVDRTAPASPPPPLAWMGGDDMLPRLCQESDFVVIAVPLAASTRGLVNATFLGNMKSTGVLLNIGRAPVVEEEALFQALQSKRIGGSVIDVWWNESSFFGGGWPASRNFSALDNIVMTPHMSAMTAGARQDAARQIARNLDHVARGEPLENVVRNGTAAAAGNRLEYV